MQIQQKFLINVRIHWVILLPYILRKDHTMELKIDTKSALIGLLVGIIVFLTLGAGFKVKEVDTYRLQMISHGKEIFYSRINSSTGQVETWKYLDTQIPYYRDILPLEEPKY